MYRKKILLLHVFRPAFTGCPTVGWGGRKKAVTEMGSITVTAQKIEEDKQK